MDVIWIHYLGRGVLDMMTFLLHSGDIENIPSVMNGIFIFERLCVLILILYKFQVHKCISLSCVGVDLF